MTNVCILTCNDDKSSQSNKSVVIPHRYVFVGFTVSVEKKSLFIKEQDLYLLVNISEAGIAGVFERTR